MILEPYHITMAVLIFVFGLMVGSFLNVCIWRLPRGQSVSEPRYSECPHCHTQLNAWDNIPVLSFVFLRARCRYCGEAISWRYPMVEALTGGLFLAVYLCQGVVADADPGQVVIMLLTTALLIVASGIDFKFRIIPDEISIYGMMGGLLAGTLLPGLHTGAAPHHTFSALTGVGPVDGFLAALIGAIGGGGIVLFFAVVGALIFHQDALGIGDVKLMAMVGALVGWKVAMIAFFIAPFFGLIYGLPLLVFKDEHHMPYGPFLSAGTVLVLLVRSRACAVLEHYGRALQKIFGVIIG